MEMCAVKVANALDTTFEALIAAENEWAKAAGRQRSTGGGKDANQLGSAAAAAAMAMETPGSHNHDNLGHAGTGRGSLATRGSVVGVTIGENSPQDVRIRAQGCGDELSEGGGNAGMFFTGPGREYT